MKTRLLCWRNLLAVVIVGSFVCVAAAAPLLSPPDDPENPTPFRVLWGNTEPLPLPPNQDAPLGTVVYRGGEELFHFDVFHSLVWGTRAALRFGLVTALVTACFGVLVGLTSGYVGGWFNSLAIRVTDVFLAFPMIAGVWLFRQILFDAYDQLHQATWLYVNWDALDQPIAIVPTLLQRLLMANWLDPLMLTFILFSWMPYARIINAIVLREKQEEYVMAARSLGASSLRIIFRHLLPNVIAPAIVLVARDIGALVILQAAFTFVGINGTMGIQWEIGRWFSPVPEWARLLVMGREWIIGAYGNPFTYWWMYLPATLALILFGVGWNVLGDRLNVILNPRVS
jgi:peptide/nickel transport system permease protein